MTSAEECNSAAGTAAQYLEEFSGPQDKIEATIRTKLVEFAAELQSIKSLREVSKP